MSDVKITVGGQMEEDAARRFVDAWHRAEQGDSFQARHMACEVTLPPVLARGLTGRGAWGTLDRSFHGGR